MPNKMCQITYQITRPAKIEYLEEFCNFVSDQVAAHGASMKVIHEVDLAIDEAATNIINYAYEDAAGDLTVSISLEEPKTLVIDLIDHGKPFNPLTIPPPDLESDIDHRPIGGLGLHLIRKFTDSVSYRREDDKNILTFRKVISESPC
ncbi:MAG: ATP-binding protein [Deltaproteobacteria bacterium]|nr:ATP-binding protein [Deltaproteobacteria bacterium]